jgi:hypothetical protein
VITKTTQINAHQAEERLASAVAAVAAARTPEEIVRAMEEQAAARRMVEAVNIASAKDEADKEATLKRDRQKAAAKLRDRYADILRRLDAALAEAAMVNVEAMAIRERALGLLGSAQTAVPPLAWGELADEEAGYQPKLAAWRRAARSHGFEL